MGRRTSAWIWSKGAGRLARPFNAPAVLRRPRVVSCYEYRFLLCGGQAKLLFLLSRVLYSTQNVSFSPSLPMFTDCPSDSVPRISIAASSVSTCFCRYRFTGRAP